MNGYGHFLAGAPVVPRLLGVPGDRAAGRRRAVLGARHGARLEGALAHRAPALRACRRARCSPRRCSRSPAIGAWIYYNTNVINRYVPGDVAKQQQADYEKLLSPVQGPAAAEDHRRQGRCRHLSARAHGRRARPLRARRTRPTSRSATCTCACRCDMKLDRARLSRRTTSSATTARTATRSTAEDAARARRDDGLRLHAAATGAAASATRRTTTRSSTTARSSTAACFPHFGYRRERPARRPQRPARVRPAVRRRACRRSTTSRRAQFNLLGRDADWVTFETTVSTVPDQIALAPGYLREGMDRTIHRAAAAISTTRWTSRSWISSRSSRRSYAVKKRHVERHRARGLLRPEARVQRRPHHGLDEEVAGVLRHGVRAVPVPPDAHARVPGLRALRRRASPTRCRSPSRSASSPTCAIRKRSTTRST